MHSRTPRLDLGRPTHDDLAGLYRITSDPRVWTHFPSLRHDRIELTAEMLTGWQREWARDELGTWVVRRRDRPEIIGYGGCSLRDGRFWNLGYRFSPEAQKQGFATEVASEAIRQADTRNGELPIVAYLVEHNTGSARVAEKVGLKLRHRAPDVGNPDPDVMRLIYADRYLLPDQLDAVLR